MSKGPDAFRTISEVADELDLPQHVLRFWETRFSQIRPMKRGGGRRYYRPDDVELLKGIRHLLYGEGYTIKGVQRILKEQGPRHVIAAGQDAAWSPVPASALDDAAAFAGEGEAEDDALFSAIEDDEEEAPAAPPPRRESRETERREPVFEPRTGAGPILSRSNLTPAAATPPKEASTMKLPPAPAEPERSADPFRPPPLVAPVPLPPFRSAEPPVGTPAARRSDPIGPSLPEDDDPIPAGIRPRSAEAAEDETFRPGGPLSDNARPSSAASISRDEIRRLQATLFELLECKRILDQAR